MTGFLDRLTAHLHGEAPTVTLRPRGPFEPDPGPGPGAWPGADVTGPRDEADDGSGRRLASGPWPRLAESGSVDFSLMNPGVSVPGRGDLGVPDSGLTDSGLTDSGVTGPGVAGSGVTDPGLAGRGVAVPGLGGRGPDGAGLNGPGLAGPGLAGPRLAGTGLAGADLGNAVDPAPLGPLPEAGSRAAGHAAGRPPDGPSRPGALPGRPLTPDEGPSGPDAPAGSRSRPGPASTVRAAADGTPLPLEGATGAGRRPEGGAPAPAPRATGPGGATRAAPTVIHKNSPPATMPATPPGPPSLDELLARHVVPALRAAGAMRSGRDTVRLAEEPVTEHRGGDVHVHLGRIEVVQPPAAAQSRPARSRPRPPAPDHEAYLAARRKPDRR